MRIIIAIRHGQPINAGYADESLRPLSPAGQLDILNLAKTLSYIPSYIFSSPLLRTMQTAEILSEYFNIASEPLDSLGNDFDEADVLNKIKAAPEQSVIFLVGHAPSLSEFIKHLIFCGRIPNSPDALKWLLVKPYRVFRFI